MHLDEPGGDERRFKQLNAAFQVLNDPELRGAYDQRWRKASGSASESPEEDGNPKDVAEERKADAPRAASRGLRNRLRAKLHEMFGTN